MKIKITDHHASFIEDFNNAMDSRPTTPTTASDSTMTPTQPSATPGGALACYTCGQGPARCNCTNYMMGAPTPSATPRTDALWSEHKYFANKDEAEEAIADFKSECAKLETELAAARQKFHDDLSAACDETHAKDAELAAAKAECERLRFSTEGHLLKTIQQQTELARLRADLAKERQTLSGVIKLKMQFEAESAGRLKVLEEKAEEARREWLRAERAEAQLAEARKDSERLDALFTVWGAGYCFNPGDIFTQMLGRGRDGIDELIKANPNIARKP